MMNLRTSLPAVWLALLLGIGSSGCSSSTTNSVAPPANLVQGSGRFVGNQLQLDNGSASLPGSNTPLRFLHVVLGSVGGNGTAENPFGQVSDALGAASRGDIVYVRAGSGSNTAGFTIPPGIQVLSASPIQTLNTQQQGAITLPFSGSNQPPIVTSTVTLSSDTTLSGFRLDVNSGPGVQGSNLTGTVTLANNIVPRTVAGSSPANRAGFSFNNTSGALSLVITDNAISNTTGPGVAIVTGGTVRVNAQVTNNQLDNTVGSGFLFRTQDSGQITTTIFNNRVSNNSVSIAATACPNADPNATPAVPCRLPQDGAVRFGLFDDARVIATVSNNTILNNLSNGIFFGTSSTSQATATIQNNTSNGNEGNGIFLGAQDVSVVSASVSGNTLNENKASTLFPNPPNAPSGNGIFFGPINSGKQDITFANNTANSNETSGFYFFVGNSGFAQASIGNNTFSSNVGNGIEMNVGIASPPAPPQPAGPAPSPPPVGTLQGSVTAFGNTIKSNIGQGPPQQGGGGITVRTFQNATFRTVLENNTLTDNATASGALAGIGMQTFDRSDLRATVRNNTLDRNRVVPGFIAQALNGQACLRLTNNVSDTAYLLYKLPLAGSPNSSTGFEAKFLAETTNNAGPIFIPVLPLDPLGSCVVP